MSRARKSRPSGAGKPSYTVSEINSFLTRRVGRKNHVRDTFEDVWVIVDQSHVGEGRGFRVVTRDGEWSRVVIEPTALN